MVESSPPQALPSPSMSSLVFSVAWLGIWTHQDAVRMLLGQIKKQVCFG